MHIRKWLLWVTLITIIISALILLYFYGSQTLTDYIKKLIGVSSYANIYNLYGYQYIDGLVPGGSIIKQYNDVESPLICANYAAVTDGCVGAAYNSLTNSCSLVSSIMPLTSNSDFTTITLGARNKKNNVSTFTPMEGINSKGVLYQDNVLNYQPFAAALCANIPECSGYAAIFSDGDKLPSGCLLTDSTQAPITKIDNNAVLFTGVRTDGKLYNNGLSTQNGGPFFRWGTNISENSATPITMQTNTTLDSCAVLARSTPGAKCGVWDAETSGKCTVYDNVGTISDEKLTTYITWIANTNYLAYSNQYTKTSGVDYPNASIITTGLENANIYTIDDALLACANSQKANCIIHETISNTFQFKYVTSQDLPTSVASTTNAYTLPATFI